MTLSAACLARKVLRVIQRVGVTARLDAVTKIYNDTTRISTETVVAHTVTCSDLVDENKRYGNLQTDISVTGTFYVASRGLLATPKPLDRVVYLTRTFKVVGVWPYRLQGSLIAWRLDVAEIGV